MANNEPNVDRVNRIEKTLQQFQQTLQKITVSVTSLTTQVCNEQQNLRRQPPNRGPNDLRSLRHQAQGFRNDEDEDSNVEDDLGDKEARGGKL